MLGVACGLVAGVPSWWAVAGSVALAGVSFAWLARRGRSVAALVALLFALGAGHARMGIESRWRPDAVAPRLAHRMEYVRFAAVARGDAVRRPPRPGRRSGDVCVEARAVALNRAGRWERVDEPLQVVLRGVPDDAAIPLYGERWAFHGLVRPGHLRGGGTQAIVDADRAVRWDAGHGNPFVNWCMGRRRACRKILAAGLDDRPEERAILQALLLGYREDLPETLRADFRTTGTIHIFAISGAHVGIMVGVIALLLQALFVPRTWWFWAAAPLLVAYTVGTGAAVSAVRACLMAVVAMGALCVRRRPDGASSLLAAALAILAVAPTQLFDLGFILSFTAVASLLVLVPPIQHWTDRLFARDAWRLPREYPWLVRTLVFAPARFLKGNAVVSCAAWLGTAPLTAYWFNLFSPIALLVNLAVIPIVSCILACGVASLLGAWMGDFWPVACNGVAAWLAGWLSKCIAWASSVPGGHWFVRSPPAALVWGGYAAMLGGLWAWSRGRRWVLWPALAAVAAAYAAWGTHDARRCRVSVFDAGESNAVLVQAGRSRVMVDTGEAFRAYSLLRKMRAQGVNRLDAIVLTHADAAHIGALPYILDAVPTAEVWVPDPVWPSPAMRETLERYGGEGQGTGPLLRRVSAGDSGLWAEGVGWDVLWPAKGAAMSCADDASLVMRVGRGGASLLLMGDATATAERAILASGGDAGNPSAALLLASDHGGAEGTPAVWLDAVEPDAVLASCGPHAKERHPDGEFLSLLEERGLPLWRTDRDGDLHVEFLPGVPRWPRERWRVRCGERGAREE
jgi:competence protein ComEC